MELLTLIVSVLELIDATFISHYVCTVCLWLETSLSKFFLSWRSFAYTCRTKLWPTRHNAVRISISNSVFDDRSDELRWKKRSELVCGQSSLRENALTTCGQPATIQVTPDAGNNEQKWWRMTEDWWEQYSNCRDEADSALSVCMDCAQRWSLQMLTTNVGQSGNSLRKEVGWRDVMTCRATEQRRKTSCHGVESTAQTPLSTARLIHVCLRITHSLCGPSASSLMSNRWKWADLEGEGAPTMPNVALCFAYAVHYSLAVSMDAGASPLSTNPEGRTDAPSCIRICILRPQN